MTRLLQELSLFTEIKRNNDSLDMFLKRKKIYELTLHIQLQKKKKVTWSETLDSRLFGVEKFFRFFFFQCFILATVLWWHIKWNFFMRKYKYWTLEVRSTWADLFSWRSVQNLGIWTEMELLLIGWLNCKASPSILMYLPISFWGKLAAIDISCYIKEDD